MPDLELSGHARNMLRERCIPEEWLWRTLQSPDRAEVGPDGNTHYIKSIREQGGRFLRVVVNTQTAPRRVITVFFDRRLRRQA